MADNPPLPPKPTIQRPMADPEVVKAYLGIAFQHTDPLEFIQLYNAAMQFESPGVPPPAMPMLAAYGMALARVIQGIEQLCPAAEGATPEQWMSELPEWALAMMLAVGLIKPASPPAPPPEEDLATRAARSGLVVAR